MYVRFCVDAVDPLPVDWSCWRMSGSECNYIKVLYSRGSNGSLHIVQEDFICCLPRQELGT